MADVAVPPFRVSGVGGGVSLWRIFFFFLLLGCLALDVSAASSAFDVAKSKLDPGHLTQLSSLLVDYAKINNDTDAAFSQDGRLGKFTKLAYLLGPTNRPAVLLHAKLKKRYDIPPAEAVVDGKTVLAKLLEVAKAAAQGSDTDAQIARHLYALGLLIDPTHEDCLYESELSNSRFGPIDWLSLLDEYSQVVSVADGFQQAINGLVVMDINDVQVGQVAKILLTFRSKPDANDLQVQFARGVGQQMVTSLEEAVRYWRKISAGLRLQTGLIEISFEDKYSSKDGGSAGTAYAVLMHSFMDRFDIDEQFAVTGDISVEGKVLKIGGVFAKVRGAKLDGCTRVAIPANNVEDLIDQVILNGPETIGQIEIYSISTVQDAIALARRNKAKRHLEAAEIFGRMTPQLEGDKWKQTAEIGDHLDQILSLCPDHVSARLLKDLHQGRLRKTLSLTRSILHMNDIFAGYMNSISSDSDPSFGDIADDTSPDNIDKAITGLADAEPMLHPETLKAHTHLVQACRAIRNFIVKGKQVANRKAALERRHITVEKTQAMLTQYKRTLNPSSRASVGKYNNQVKRVNGSIRGYEQDRKVFNDLVRTRNEMMAKVNKKYASYMAAVRDLVQDQEILEKLIRGE